MCTKRYSRVMICNFGLIAKVYNMFIEIILVNIIGDHWIDEDWCSY